MEHEGRGPRVVVGLDSSAGARAALRFGLSEARRRNLPLDVVTAFVSPERLGATLGIPIVADLATVAGDAQASARAVVDEVVAAEHVDRPREGLPDITVRAVAGDPGPVLTAAASDAELLVLGHAGRGAVTSVVLGSVGWWCLRHLRCPLTIVPAHPSQAASADRLVAAASS